MNENASRLWDHVIPIIKCDYCGSMREAPGSDDHDFAEHLDKEGWTVRANDDRVKCPKCNKNSI